MRRRLKPHDQTLTGMIERILALVEDIARESGIVPPPSDVPPDPWPEGQARPGMVPRRGEVPKRPPRSAQRPVAAVTPDELAHFIHDRYEALAPDYGYETRRETAVAWDDVPPPNKALMREVARQALAFLAQPSPSSPQPCVPSMDLLE